MNIETFFQEKITFRTAFRRTKCSWHPLYCNKDGSKKEVTYKLIGAFEDDSWEFFTGTWEENGENYQFDALLELVEKFTPNVEIIEEFDNVEDSSKPRSANVQAKIFPERYGAMRQRATRSDARKKNPGEVLSCIMDCQCCLLYDCQSLIKL